MVSRLRSWSWRIVCGCIAASGLCAPAAATDFYVRSGGTDGANGRSPATAFATIRKAADSVLNPGDRVIVGPGTYAEGDLAPANNGIANRPIVFLADTSGSLTGDVAGPVRLQPPANRSTGFLLLAKRGITIDGFTISGASDACIQVRSSADGSAASAAIVVRNVHVSGCSKRGIDITAVGSVLVEDSTATENTSGISVQGPGGVNPNPLADLGFPTLTLRRNQVFDNQGPGIVVERSVGGSIRDNQVLDNLLNGILVRDSQAVLVDGNEVRRNGDGGIRVDVGTNVDSGARDAQVRDNVVIGNAKIGIALVCSGTLVVHANEVRSNSGSGLSIEGVGGDVIAQVGGNQSIANASHGLFVTGVTAGTFTTNTLNDNSATGLLVRSSSGLVLDDNLVRGNRDGGVLLGKGTGSVAVGDVTASRLRIENNLGGGLDIVSRGRVDITQCTIPAASLSGVSVTSSASGEVRVRGCTIANATQNAIFVDAAGSVLVDGNVLPDSGESAIVVRRSGDLVATANQIQRSGRNGLDLQADGSVEVRANSISRAGAVGAVVESPARTMTVVVAGNVIDLSQSHGLRLAGSAAGSIDDNTVTNAGAQGIVLDAVAGVMVTDNQVSSSGNSGIQARASVDLLVVANEVADSPDGGIDLNVDGTIEVRANEVDGSGDSGISLVSPRGDAAVLVDDNRVDTSGAHGIFLSGIDGGAVRRNEVRTSVGSAVLARGASNLTIDDNVVAANQDGGIAINKGDTTIGHTIRAHRNSVRESATGIQIFAGGEVSVGSNTVLASPVSGISIIGDETLEATVDDNDVSDSGADGILVSGGASVQATKNQVLRSGEVGIHLPDVASVGLSENEIRNSTQDAIRVTGRGPLQVRRNTLAASGGSSLFAEALEDGAFELAIEENTASGQAQGIFVRGCSGGSIAENTIRNSRVDGVLLRMCSGVALVGNDIGQSTRNGILINLPSEVVGSGFSLRRNRVADSGESGVLVYAHGSVVATRNEIQRSGSTALSVVAQGRSRQAFSDNELALGGAHGLFVSGADKGLVQNTVAYGNADTGITLRSSPDMLVANNLLYGNATDGLAIGTAGGRSPRATVTNNTIYGNGGRGFLLGSGGAASEGATFVNNIIEGNVGIGVAVDRLSADSYLTAFNMNSDGYGEDTPRSPFDFEGPAGFLDPLGPDAVLASSDADFRLRQVRGGQSADSRAVNAGSAATSEIGLGGSTATGSVPDIGQIDLGYHYEAELVQTVRLPVPFLPLYVRADGDDANNGRTVETALRSIRTAGTRAVSGVTVIVAPGRYVESDTVRMRLGAGRVTFLADRTGERTGSAAGPIVLDAAGADTGFIVLDSDDVVIDGFHVTNAASAGIQIRVGSERAVVRNNVVFSNSRRGIEIRGGDAGLVANNLVYGNATGGIQLQQTRGSEVSGNTIYGNGENGITVGGGTSPQLGTLDRAHLAGDARLDVRLASAAVVVSLAAGDIVQIVGDPQRYRVASDTTSTLGLLQVAVEPALGQSLAFGSVVSDETLAAVESRVQRNIVAANRFGIQVRQNSLAGYACGGNVVADGLSGQTPRCDSDILADPELVDPDGSDGLLGGTGFADDDFRLLQSVSPAVDLIECDEILPGVAGTTDPDGFADECPVDAGYHYPLAAVGAL